jgi:hypothetical protein
MDSELLRWLYHRLLHGVTARPRRRCVYGDGLIALAGLYAVGNNRSVRWAADRRNWPVWFRHALPSYSQLRRRLLRRPLDTLVRQLDEQIVRRLGRSDALSIDAKAFVVALHSRDRDATVGRVRGGFARGYALSVVRDRKTSVIHAAAVCGLRRGEATVARRLVRLAPLRGAVLRADANYDSVALYRDVAGRGGRLIAARRKPGRGVSRGHPQHPDRLAAIATLEQTPGGRATHTRERSDVERGFADLGGCVGLFCLPPFVRRLHRVRRWIRAKLLLYHVTLLIRRTM